MNETTGSQLNSTQVGAFGHKGDQIDVQKL